MSLRQKVLVLFVALATIPLLALGVFEHVQSRKAVRALVAAQVAAIVDRAVEEFEDRYSLRESELVLLAENAETQRLYTTGPGEMRDTLSPIPPATAYYLEDVWELLRRSYRYIDFLDTTGSVVYRLGPEPVTSGLQSVGQQDEVRLERLIRDPTSQLTVGTVVAATRLAALIPEEALASQFGRSGYSLVLDLDTDRILYHHKRRYLRQSSAMLFGPTGWDIAEALSSRRGVVTYVESDSQRVAVFTQLEALPWTIFASSAIEEFAGPFARIRLVYLVAVLAVTIVVSTVFTLLIRKATKSLIGLTAAAEEVGAGNFSPQLPEPGSDEVGRLVGAFAAMAGRIDETVRQIESSRQLAAVGEFASRLAHEIRNPLTSLKLNLQRVTREAEAGNLPDRMKRPLDICLREIERLDHVVRGTLAIGRSGVGARSKFSISSLIDEALEFVRPELDERGIRVLKNNHAPEDTVLGTADQLQGAFLNLFLNAIDAMPNGGQIRVRTYEVEPATGGARRVRVAISDTGPGIPPEVRDKVLDPFFSTKAQGSGLGLAVALHTIEGHGGSLRLSERSEVGAGAEFVIDLPLAEEARSS